MATGLFQEKELLQKLEQWGLKDSLKGSTYRFNLKYEATRQKEFVTELLNCPPVKQALGLFETVSQVETQNLRTQCLDMTFFDRLQNGIVGAQGLIRGTYQDQVHNIEIADLLREYLLKEEESEHEGLFSELEQKELLFRLFRLLVLGGGVCQYEDSVAPYLEHTKNLYKSLVTVKRDSETQKVFIDSQAIEVKCIETFFPLDQENPHPQNVVYLVVNPS